MIKVSDKRKRAVWLAFENGDGDRLVEIAQEHVKLARMAGELPINDQVNRQIIYTKIEALRAERDAIIDKYTEVDDDVTD